MKIQDACENKGTLPDFPNMYCLIVYLADNKLSPCWYNAKTDHFAREVTGQEVLRTDWLPFPEEKEIRPKKAGELWESVFGMKWFIHYMCSDQSLGLAATSEQKVCLNLDELDIVHNKNNWKLIYSPDKEVMAKINVEDDSVERIEIEGVWWIEYNGIAYPDANKKDGSSENIFKSLIDKPRMKMILETSKDKP